ncbi:dihydropteroate synthase [Arthrobacter silviterrae]|uniref:Dihydropteroate synthase n=1 Tax=Arthrobacter silviterrae TaxID=2026658 RepID=A0ABX0D6R0_9MICC|nr:MULTISPECIES: dihydropteroate synthase [Arthrobacter]MCU6480363.1 dihydropteroate synthase [Arthrobacter sp. A2-55]MDQ0278375.1 dihydropteroate synthase [Arthrobacter silviterrae]NGN82366.1 dihydropteroate synthase [Arthrobacter silviterrae]
MDSLAAAPGTGPATSPLPVLRARTAMASFAALPTDRTLVMGILNCTPDSFSDGGEYDSIDTAIAHGLRMFYGGADIIDVGGESTRPGALDVDEEEEQRRIMPVIATLAKAGALVSVDTRHASTAALALDAGAGLINDVSGTNVNPDMIALIAERQVPYVLMHSRGDSRHMDSLTTYTDVVDDVVRELGEVRERFYAAGVKPEMLIVDPGIGFSKNAEQNWELLANLHRVAEMGNKVLVGTSRKRFLGSLLTTAGKAAAPKERDDATSATTALAAAQGVWGVRVHDVGASLDAAKVAARLLVGGRNREARLAGQAGAAL